MGSRIQLNTNFSLPTGKTLSDLDSLLPPIQGALLLVDASHSLGGLGTGLPTPGRVFRNIAASQAIAAKGGVGSVDGMGLIFNYGSSGAGVDMAMERTPKGGLHVAVRQDALTAQTGFKLDWGTDIKSLLIGKKADDIYLSLWQANTRFGLIAGVNVPHFGIVGSSSPSGNAISFLGAIGADNLNADRDLPLPGSGRRLGRRNTALALGPAIRNIASDTFTETSAGNLSAINVAANGWGAAFGSFGGTAAGQPTAAASWVFYRVYVEDLTISGRTYADVDAQDYALFQKECLTPGGKYYGDTWTPPNILAGA